MKLKSLFLSALALTLLSLLSVTAYQHNQNSLRTSLLAAVRADNATAALQLLAKGANPNSRTSASGWSALHFAVRNGNTQIVEALLKAGANPNYAGSLEGKTGSDAFLEPISIAEAALDFVRQVPASRTNQLLIQSGLNDPALLKSMRDSKASIRYQRVVEDLAKVSRQS